MVSSRACAANQKSFLDFTTDVIGGFVGFLRGLAFLVSFGELL